MFGATSAFTLYKRGNTVLRVWIYSPNLVVNEALTTYVTELGHAAQIEPEGADLAVWNLCGQTSPYAPPPPLPTLALLCTSNRDDLIELLRLGYQGCQRPADSLEQFAEAIATVAAGQIWADADLIEAGGEKLETPKLTPREAEVLSLVSLGLPNKRIAKRLGIAEKTVKIHVSSVLGKQGAKNRIELLVNRYGLSS